MKITGKKIMNHIPMILPSPNSTNSQLSLPYQKQRKDKIIFKHPLDPLAHYYNHETIPTLPIASQTARSLVGTRSMAFLILLIWGAVGATFYCEGVHLNWHGSFVGKIRNKVWHVAPLCLFWMVWQVHDRRAFESK